MARLGRGVDRAELEAGAVLSLAFPDRIARQRNPGDRRYVLASGPGALLPGGLTGWRGRPGWLRPISMATAERRASGRPCLSANAALLELHADAVTTEPVCFWDDRSEKVIAEEQVRLGAIVLKRRPAKPDPAARRMAMIEGIQSLGVTAACLERRRAAIAGPCTLGAFAGRRSAGPLRRGIGPMTSRPGCPRTSGRGGLILRRWTLLRPWKGGLGGKEKRRSTRWRQRPSQPRPETRLPIDYSGDVPKIAVRLQEMLGQSVHPNVGPDRMPLLVELLSPGGRPIQTTADLPGFWGSSYTDVRKDMRGRYPKHAWPRRPDQCHSDTTRQKKHVNCLKLSRSPSSRAL